MQTHSFFQNPSLLMYFPKWAAIDLLSSCYPLHPYEGCHKILSGTAGHVRTWVNVRCPIRPDDRHQRGCVPFQYCTRMEKPKLPQAEGLSGQSKACGYGVPEASEYREACAD